MKLNFAALFAVLSLFVVSPTPPVAAAPAQNYDDLYIRYSTLENAASMDMRSFAFDVENANREDACIDVKSARKNMSDALYALGALRVAVANDSSLIAADKAAKLEDLDARRDLLQKGREDALDGWSKYCPS